MNIFLKGTVYCSFLLLFFHIKKIYPTSIIDEKTFLDLDIARIPVYIDNTNTYAGKTFLEQALMNPIYEKDILVERQKALLFFIEHPMLVKNLRKKFSALCEHEKVLLNVSTSSDSLTQKIIHDMYFRSPSLKKYNTNSYALDAAFASHIAGLCLPLCEYLILHTSIATLLNLKQCTHLDSHPTPTPQPDATSNEVAVDIPAHAHGGSLYPALLQAAILGCHVPSLLSMTKTIKTSFRATKDLKAELLHVAEYLASSKEVYGALKSRHHASAPLAPVTILQSFFGEHPTCSADCLTFIRALAEFRASKNSLLPNRIGKTLALYAQYTDVKEELLKLVQALGEIDHYIGLATLMNNQTKELPWCLVEYTCNETPFMDIQGLRHLFLSGRIIKSWNMSCNTTQHTLITGDNGSGKSTYINGLGQALVLAQSLGIMPAQKASLTPFYSLNTYRLIQDSITQGTSRFYAECSRVEDILEKIENTPHFCCVLLDEPFTSTHITKGAYYVQQALERLFSTTNSISFTVTHYYTSKALIENHPRTRHISFS